MENTSIASKFIFFWLRKCTHEDLYMYSEFYYKLDMINNV